MMPGKTRRRKVIVFSALAAFVLYAVLTGGLAFSNRREFGGQRNVTLVAGLQTDLWLAPRFSDWSIPGVCHYYGTSEPFGLRIQIWDAGKTFTGIEVEEIVIAYTDGQTVRHSAGWNRVLKEYTQFHSSSSGSTETRMMMLSDTIEDLVVRHQSVTITLKGRLLKNDGTSAAFDTTEEFVAGSDFTIGTYWQVLAGV